MRPRRRGQRYKGTAPFLDLELDRRTFFGRGRESRTLLSLVLGEALVVLFGKSGLGKSSLINAGLAEPLRRRGYFPVMARLGDREPGPLGGIFDGVRSAARDAEVDLLRIDSGADDEDALDHSSLWRFFKTTELWSQSNDPLRPVLILDQFEELFTLHQPKARGELIGQLAELVRGRATPAERSTAGRALDDGPPDLKIVISLREDFLANLEELARDIPGILHNRYRLGPLTLDGARRAIVEPARLDDEGFETVPFSYREEAVDEIVTFLGKQRQGEETVESDEVEPVHLQLICQYLEEQVRDRQASREGVIEISDADLGGERRMQRVMEGFYDRTVGAIKSLRERRAVRKLCEKRLISGTKRRLTEDEDEIERRFKISKELLRRLVDARLLRAEPRLGGTFYELSHDRLVEPILQSRARRRRKTWQRLSAAPLVIAILFGLAALLQSAVSRALYPPGKSFQACASCPDMIVIPAGRFTMGSPEEEEGRDDDEGPQHEVKIARFALAKHEVTREQFAVFAQETKFEGSGCFTWDGDKDQWKLDDQKSWDAPGFEQTPGDPVTCVSWQDSQSYIEWLSVETGDQYRLPSEAEWEYAARAGTTTSRYWGEDSESACRYANVADQITKLTFPDWTTHECQDGYTYTAPAGSLAVNNFGLYDMLGNVSEWNEDCRNGGYSGAPVDGSAWLSGNCARRMLRGGSWGHKPSFVRAANRMGGNTPTRNENAGFRVARTLP
ncbi:MAG: SUMF1/EgtB/PvdO family nonheme iron enzyme [bacterium]|nr:SUMF1/EgtB/PvdO family nonheme iron enzyme [bacterium]